MLFTLFTLQQDNLKPALHPVGLEINMLVLILARLANVTLAVVAQVRRMGQSNTSGGLFIFRQTSGPTSFSKDPIRLTGCLLNSPLLHTRYKSTCCVVIKS